MFLFSKYFGLVTTSFVSGCIYLSGFRFAETRSYEVMWLVVPNLPPHTWRSEEELGSWLDVGKASAHLAAAASCPGLKHSPRAASLLSLQKPRLSCTWSLCHSFLFLQCSQHWLPTGITCSFKRY